ncbi:hypothetical protein hairong_159 [Pseudomonas phage hairong]|nr:hypothetical protein hairong_159 [Pseudomonas phage hairong]
MKTLRDLIDQLIDIENTGGTALLQDLPIAGMVGSSGTAYELGSPYVRHADEELADMLGIEKGAAYVEVYLGN